MVPIVANLLASGLGLLGDAVLAKGKEFVEDKLGVKIPDGNLPPETVAMLKVKEIEHEEWLVEAGMRKRQQEIDEAKMYLEDRQDARDMQKEALKQSDIFSKRFIYWFAIGWSVVTMIYIFCITFIAIPKDNQRFADTILGFMLGTLIATIIQFFFGSSKGSQDKDAIVSEVVKNVSGR